MTTTVGVNGFGRIGRAFMRRALERDDLEVVAVNDVTDARTLAHLLEFDSTYGQLGRTVEYGPDSLTVAGRTVPVLSARDPAGIDWGELGASVVVESTGKFRAREDAALHLKGGARKVVISAPGKGADLTVVVGVNDGEYDPQRHDVVSAASCTTNCVVPMAKVLHDEFGLVRGFMTTIHAYTGDQMLLDGPHKDLRRARSAAVNIVPTTTGAARTAGVVIPELAGRRCRPRPGRGRLTDRPGRGARPGGDGGAGQRRLRARGRRQPGGRAAVQHLSPRIPRYHRRLRLLRVRLRPYRGGGQPGEGVRLVRQRVGLCVPAGRPRRAGRGAFLAGRTNVPPCRRACAGGTVAVKAERHEGTPRILGWASVFPTISRRPCAGRQPR